MSTRLVGAAGAAMKMKFDDNELALAMLIALRGGPPKACDFCGKRFTAKRYPVPEEAGAWACSECLARWETPQCT